MSRLLLAVLLIANLLVCPVRCLACEATVSVADSPAVAVCSCCAEAQECPAPDAPLDRHDDRCQCQDCICDGATLQDGLSISSGDDLIVGWVDLPTRTIAGQTETDRLLANVANCFVRGRDLRVAHQSWLI